MSQVFVPPADARDTAAFSLAGGRPSDLTGRRVLLLNSTKFNSDHLLDGIGELLAKRYRLKELVRERKPYFGRPIPEEQAKELAQRADVVITAIGD
ncbi:MAG: hypothetical protein J2O39_01230 [Acidimicrobiales bacterium]|nr:hypothetical protein [Acidimicrobiales bacterium]MBO0886159.1 hypothetical protein [Acidimicrobiales bacterium]MBO0892971.1 hypothetical protein [Acidimicrobiales bacterium]